jgi:hypothetical protein
MTPPPLLLLVVLALGLVLCRPWLESRRPSVTAGLVFGAVLGWAGQGARGLSGAAGPWLDAATAQGLAALPAGWLALSAGAWWDASVLRQGGGRWRAWLPAALALTLATLVAAAMLGLRAGEMAPGEIDGGVAPGLGAVALGGLIAAGCLSLDPESARAALERQARPGPAARIGPRVVSFWLGLALAATAIFGALGRASTDGAAPGVSLLRLTAPFALGAAAGLVAIALLRAAQGRALLITVVVALVVAAWSAARWLEAAPLAALFTAGLVLSRDAARRDLVGTVLREMETPATVLLLIAAGAWVVALGAPAVRPPTFWVVAAVLGIAAPFAWRLLPLGGMRALLPLPLSPLAAAIAMHILAGPAPPVTAGAAAGVIAALVLSEILHAAWRRRAAAGGEPDTGLI